MLHKLAIILAVTLFAGTAFAAATAEISTTNVVSGATLAGFNQHECNRRLYQYGCTC
jgi:hypothetical protein